MRTRNLGVAQLGGKGTFSQEVVVTMLDGAVVISGLDWGSRSCSRPAHMMLVGLSSFQAVGLGTSVPYWLMVRGCS